MHWDKNGHSRFGTRDARIRLRILGNPPQMAPTRPTKPYPAARQQRWIAAKLGMRITFGVGGFLLAPARTIATISPEKRASLRQTPTWENEPSRRGGAQRGPNVREGRPFPVTPQGANLPVVEAGRERKPPQPRHVRP